MHQTTYKSCFFNLCCSSWRYFRTFLTKGTDLPFLMGKQSKTPSFHKDFTGKFTITRTYEISSRGVQLLGKGCSILLWKQVIKLMASPELFSQAHWPHSKWWQKGCRQLLYLRLSKNAWRGLICITLKEKNREVTICTWLSGLSSCWAIKHIQTALNIEQMTSRPKSHLTRISQFAPVWSLSNRSP